MRLIARKGSTGPYGTAYSSVGDVTSSAGLAVNAAGQILFSGAAGGSMIILSDELGRATPVVRANTTLPFNPWSMNSVTILYDLLGRGSVGSGDATFLNVTGAFAAEVTARFDPLAVRGAIITGQLPPPCYANCDLSSTPPILNVSDFVCFQNRFAQGDPYANCDGSTVEPVLNISDFICFLNRFAAGCP
jgi:hypothetical protein